MRSSPFHIHPPCQRASAFLGGPRGAPLFFLLPLTIAESMVALVPTVPDSGCLLTPGPELLRCRCDQVSVLGVLVVAYGMASPVCDSPSPLGNFHHPPCRRPFCSSWPSLSDEALRIASEVGIFSETKVGVALRVLKDLLSSSFRSLCFIIGSKAGAGGWKKKGASRGTVPMKAVFSMGDCVLWNRSTVLTVWSSAGCHGRLRDQPHHAHVLRELPAGHTSCSCSGTVDPVRRGSALQMSF